MLKSKNLHISYNNNNHGYEMNAQQLQYINHRKKNDLGIGIK